MQDHGNQERVYPHRYRKKKVTEWTGWRGPNRDGQIPTLPKSLPEKIKPIWTVDLSAKGLGGVAATEKYVLLSDREVADSTDAFICLDAQTGKKIWTVRNPAPGNLDYGNSPRATPLIVGDRVFLHGAFGYLSCVELNSGKVVWEINIRDEFDADDNRKWGTCASPLIAGGNLIINPGAKDASLVAINPTNGKTVWKSAGKTAGYGSFVVGTFSGVEQIIGYDVDTLGGWEPKTGKRLWTHKPESPNDFNVPTPIIYGDKLIVSTENNGTRLFAFKKDGTLEPKPIATHRKLAPDTATPVLCGDRLFGVWRRLHCLDMKDNLKEVYDSDEKPFTRYCACVSDGERVLFISLDSEFILLDGKSNEFTSLGKVKIFPSDKGVYAHPAFVGNKVYLRGESQIVAFELK